MVKTIAKLNMQQIASYIGGRWDLFIDGQKIAHGHHLMNIVGHALAQSHVRHEIGSPTGQQILQILMKRILRVYWVWMGGSECPNYRTSVAWPTYRLGLSRMWESTLPLRKMHLGIANKVSYCVYASDSPDMRLFITTVLRLCSPTSMFHMMNFCCTQAIVLVIHTKSTQCNKDLPKLPSKPRIQDPNNKSPENIP